MTVGTEMSDRVLLDVFTSRFQALAEEMAHVIQRTGFTVYVKEALDFAASVVKADGETLAFSQRMGVALTQRSLKEAFDMAAPYAEGDVVIANDPVSTKGLCTHLPDIYLWKPMFWQGSLLCFFCCFIHSTDVGGRVPGSISPTNGEIYQEGLRIPPVKLYRHGVLNEEVLSIYLLNCRIPEQNWGDIKALLAAMNTAELRLRQMIERFGLDVVRSAMDQVLAYAEESARAVIRELPDGTYRFVDLVDDDMASGQPIRIELTTRVRGGELELDFTGTDYQVASALNVPIYGKMHQFIARPFAMYVRSKNPTAPINGGIFRPLSIVAEPGSVLHPGPTAAVGVRMATVMRVQDAILGTLAEASPGSVPAASSGQVMIPLAAIPNPVTGLTRVSQIQPLAGGSGARPDRDGINGRGLNSGSMLMSVPAERLEMDLPVVMRAFGLVPDSGAPGKFRGGLALRLDFETRSPATTVTARGMERFRFRPWGLAGGYPGSLGDTILDYDGPQARRVGKIDVLHLEPGDTVRFASPSGGGYGDPLERSPGTVLNDVRLGFVTPDAAANVYGVIVDGAAVDEAATTRRRAELARIRAPRPTIDFGPERAAYERTWPPDARAELRRLLAAQPIPLRAALARLLHRRIDTLRRDGESVTPADVREGWQSLRDRIPAVAHATTANRASPG